ncbi:hypothetical protein BD311DRAFT_41137 [Dichomitus squalens]|uniref:Uncharacterized protein n=1 Tax=Dichomitus squalens TaxID=114155 RepID=A0A4Q9MAA0_9APHY|nr:hypothetical protein BD311DRAFT_41137 [Dichomitus squalens]
MLVLNILYVTFIFLPNSPLHIPLTSSSYVTKILEPITAVLISHFILDLHEAHHAMAHQENISAIEVMGSLGWECSSLTVAVDEGSLSDEQGFISPKPHRRVESVDDIELGAV